MIAFAEERFIDCIDEARPLLDQHWAEIAEDKDAIELDPDFGRYLTLGPGFVVFTVRDDGRLVGYAAYVLSYSLHYRTTLEACDDLYYVLPSHRSAGVGRGLFAFIEERLRARGVRRMTTRHKVAHPEAGFLLASMGHRHVEAIFTKVL